MNDSVSVLFSLLAKSIIFNFCSYFFLFLFFRNRYFVSAGSIISPISHTFVLHTMRTCCNNQNNTRSHGLLLQGGHCHHHTHRHITNRISNCARSRGPRLFAVMRIFRNSFPSHWHDSIEWCNVSLSSSVFAKSALSLQNAMFFLRFFSILSIVLWLLPDIVMFITTIAAYVILRKLTAPPPVEDIEENATPSTSGAPDTEEDEGPSYTFEHYLLLKRTGKLNNWECFRSLHICNLFPNHALLFVLAIFCAMATLLVAATLQPSVPSAIYFIIFLLTATVWALYKEIDRGFAILCRVLAVLLVIHISALLAYQTPWPQEYLDANNTIIR